MCRPPRRPLAALAAVTTSDKVLVVIHRDEDLAWLSLRNVVSVHVIAVDQLNAYDVLVNDDVVFTSAALQASHRRLGPGCKGEELALKARRTSLRRIGEPRA